VGRLGDVWWRRWGGRLGDVWWRRWARRLGDVWWRRWARRLRDVWRWGRSRACFVDDLLSLRLGRSCMYNPALRGRRMLDLRRRRFDFWLWLRGRLLFGRRFRSGNRLRTGRRHWSRLGRGDFSRRCFYLRGRFWSGRRLMGRRRWRRLGRRDFLRRCFFYLRGRFWSGHRLMGRRRWSWLGCRDFLRRCFYLRSRLLLSRRGDGARSRRNMRCILPSR
jgi:hypothetical protein